MEDSPLFNAGKGAVFTHEGKNELDAAIMDGKTLRAGAVAGVTTVKNPISAARAVMEKSEHVMLMGKCAEEFTKLRGLQIVDPAYFYTEARWKGLQQALAEEKVQLDHAAPKDRSGRADELIFTEGRKFGTVGCVASDQYGNLAAGTSTGGMTNKRWGRVCDPHIIGPCPQARTATLPVSWYRGSVVPFVLNRFLGVARILRAAPTRRCTALPLSALG